MRCRDPGTGQTRTRIAPDPLNRRTESFRIESVWRRHNTRLLLDALASIAAALGLWFAAASPDGRDAFYVAVAIEFAAWGAINAVFALMGRREWKRVNSLDADTREQRLLAQADRLRRLLRMNHWLNALWIGIGLALPIWGYAIWSPSLVGHGLGVLVQGVTLTLLDVSFARALRPADVVPEDRRPPRAS